MSTSTTIDLREISASFETATPQEILRWAVDAYHPRLTMATAFGAEGCVLMAMLAEIEPRVHIFNLDTGYQFAETLELRERIQERYGLRIHLVGADESVAEMESRFGGPIYGTRPDECCRIRKVEPLKQAVKGFDAWISAIRRDQTHARANAAIVEPDGRFELIKINPLANWTKQDVWRYIHDHEVPYNPLHNQGYPSIGCWPCTRPVGIGEDDRAGRWDGFAKTECGLHAPS